jgi:hypothetical protein
MDKQRFDNDNTFFGHKFTDQDLVDFVTRDMPQWKKVCDSSETDQVSFRSDEFENSVKGWLLMALAIKYATDCKRKAVKITPKIPS